MTIQIELRGVNKHYGSFHALKDIDLSIAEGHFRRARRPVGLRQVDAAPVAGRT